MPFGFFLSSSRRRLIGPPRTSFVDNAGIETTNLQQESGKLGGVAASHPNENVLARWRIEDGRRERERGKTGDVAEGKLGGSTR